MLENKYTINKNGCWVFNGCITRSGYSRLWDKNLKKADWGHRVFYRLYKGDIPPALSLDHLCRNRACVNPEHLEPVSAQVNTKRGGNSLKTKCKQGHEYNSKNSYIYKTTSGIVRYCKICQLNRNKSDNYRTQQKLYYIANRERIFAKRKLRTILH